MKATALSVKPSQRVLIGGPSDTKFKSPKFESSPQTPTSPKNYRFFGKPRNITSRGTIHSMPQINKQSSSSSSPAFAVISKSIQETQLWLVDDSDSTNQYREFDGRSTKYSNLEKLLGENKLSAIPEINGYGRSKASRSTPKGKMNNTGYNKNDTEDLRNLPAFRKIFSRPSNSPQRKYFNTANQGNVDYSPDNFNTEKLVSRAKQRTQTSGGTFRKADTGPSNYYALSAVGYHNYKYPKVTYSSQTKRRNNLLQPQNKETIENCIQNIHNQKMLLENLKNNEEVGSPEKILEDAFWAKSSPDDAAKINLGFQPFKQKLDPIQSDRQSHRIQLGFQGESIPDTSYEGNMILEEKTPSPQKRRIELKSSPGNMEGSVMPLLKKGFSPDLKRIIVNKKQSFNLKQLKMEFEHYSEISQIYLEKCKAQCMDSPKRQNEYHLYQLNNAIKEKGICLHIFFETQDCLKNQKKTIINRIFLALGVNLTSEYPIINLNQFQTLKRIAVSRDLPNTELIDFVIKFFKLEEVHLNKENFLRILRSLTEKVDTNDPQQIAYSDNLYETFIENYKLTGILKDEEHYVDLNRFRQVYLFNKMNILDLTDLITGIN